MNSPKIIFEDSDLVVIDKPAGWIVNKSDTSRYVRTIQEWVEQKVQKIEGESEFSDRGGIVHRLDKETSGILVIAKNEEAFIKLQQQWKSRNVKKTYLALVHGEVEQAEAEISASVGRLPWNRTRFGVLSEGREAVTRYKVLEVKELISGKTNEKLSLLEVYPATGRTHQIRVHMKHIGHPIFADELYAGRKTARADRKHLFRHFLHASKISLNHPVSGERLEFESELPKELSDFLSTLA